MIPRETHEWRRIWLPHKESYWYCEHCNFRIMDKAPDVMLWYKNLAYIETDLTCDEAIVAKVLES